MTTIDPRDDEELRRTREAQEAHGGSMAPGLVDETGHRVADPDTDPATGADPAVGADTAAGVDTDTGRAEEDAQLT